MSDAPSSPLAPSPRRLHAWEIAAGLVLAAGGAWALKALLGPEADAAKAELARLVPASALAQLGIAAGKYPGLAIALAVLLAAAFFLARLWAVSTRSGTVVVHSLKIVLRSFHIALFIALVNGGVASVLMDLGSKVALDAFDPRGRQPTLIVSELSQSVVLWLWNGTVGAWAAAAAIYLWVQHEKGRPATLYESVNYGLNRFSRVLGPHFRAYMAVALGMIVIVPGILFGLQYAFVDAIATLDTAEKDPLKRSRKLTSSRRAVIFRTFAAFVVWWLPFQMLGRFWLQGKGTLWYAAGGVLDHLVLLTIELCMVQIYLDLFRKPATKPATVEAPPVPATP